MTWKRKLNFVDRVTARSLKGGDISENIFSDLCQTSYSLYRKDLLAHYGCVNAVEFSQDGSIFVSGSDDRRVLVWSISHALNDNSKSAPTSMDAEHGSNVFCLAISLDNQRIFSGGNDSQTIIHDSKTAKPVDYFLHEKPVYGISLQPSNHSVFATACDDGKLRIFDLRSSSTTAEMIVASKRSPFHSIMFHPIEGRIVASANAKDGPELWDLRNPLMCLHRFANEKGAMSVRFNLLGDRLLCLRRKDPPKIYHLYHDGDIQLRAEGYSNACTMKSCCFAGDRDQFALSGSDDHNIYVWKVPLSSADDDIDQIVNNPHMILRGHRSVVNHVRYNPTVCSLASCGVEKMVKIWSPIAFPKSAGGLDQSSADEPKPRKRLTRLSRDCNMIIAPSPNFRSTEEDKKMLSFFDLLVERSSWLSSASDEDSDDDESEVDVSNEYSSTNSTSPPSSDNEESFEIDSISTPTSSSSDDEEPVPGPSGLNKFGENDSSKLELPPEFHIRHRPPIRFREMTSSSSTDDDETPIANPVTFRSFSGGNKARQFRRRAESSSSSSS